MRPHRFGQKIRLPSTIAIKHQIRKLMFEDLVKEEANLTGNAAAPALSASGVATTAPPSHTARPFARSSATGI
jgi:hypothetical protein